MGGACKRVLRMLTGCRACAIVFLPILDWYLTIERRSDDGGDQDLGNNNNITVWSFLRFSIYNHDIVFTFPAQLFCTFTFNDNYSIAT